MIIDPKGHTLKNFLGDNKLNHNDVNASIDHSLIGSNQQKSLDFNLEKNTEKLKKEKESLKKKKRIEDEKKVGFESIENSEKNREKNIERDPMKLLKIF